MNVFVTKNGRRKKCRIFVSQIVFAAYSLVTLFHHQVSYAGDEINFHWDRSEKESASKLFKTVLQELCAPLKKSGAECEPEKNYSAELTEVNNKLKITELKTETKDSQEIINKKGAWNGIVAGPGFSRYFGTPKKEDLEDAIEHFETDTKKYIEEGIANPKKPVLLDKYKRGEGALLVAAIAFITKNSQKASALTQEIAQKCAANDPAIQKCQANDTSPSNWCKTLTELAVKKDSKGATQKNAVLIFRDAFNDRFLKSFEELLSAFQANPSIDTKQAEALKSHLASKNEEMGSEFQTLWENIDTASKACQANSGGGGEGGGGGGGDQGEIDDLKEQLKEEKEARKKAEDDAQKAKDAADKAKNKGKGKDGGGGSDSLLPLLGGALLGGGLGAAAGALLGKGKKDKKDKGGGLQEMFAELMKMQMMAEMQKQQQDAMKQQWLAEFQLKCMQAMGKFNALMQSCEPLPPEERPTNCMPTSAFYMQLAQTVCPQGYRYQQYPYYMPGQQYPGMPPPPPFIPDAALQNGVTSATTGSVMTSPGPTGPNGMPLDPMLYPPPGSAMYPGYMCVDQTNPYQMWGACVPNASIPGSTEPPPVPPDTPTIVVQQNVGTNQAAVTANQGGGNLPGNPASGGGNNGLPVFSTTDPDCTQCSSPGILFPSAQCPQKCNIATGGSGGGGTCQFQGSPVPGENGQLPTCINSTSTGTGSSSSTGTTSSFPPASNSNASGTVSPVGPPPPAPQ